MEFTGIRHVQAVMGGFHLNKASANRLEKTADYFNGFSNLQLFPSHCTGDSSIEYLSQNAGAEVRKGYAGMQFSFGNP
jgi:7,8-dihydropterin-6-yl-methyl-4-(beta-D-ribofuranosyl)aminobenzene 5'-phosphate synthase